jgi:hypothetical protein
MPQEHRAKAVDEAKLMDMDKKVAGEEVAEEEEAVQQEMINVSVAHYRSIQ